MRSARLRGISAILLAACALAAAAEEPVARPLAPGAAVGGRLALGASHRFEIELAAGDLLEIIVEQRGIDVATEVLGPSGATLLVADRAIGSRGPEPLAVVAGETGRHRIEVRAAHGDPRLGDAPEGEYELAVAAVRPATAEDRRRARAVGLSYAPAAAGAAGDDPAAARAALDEAAALWRGLGEAGWEGEVADRICLLERRRRALAAAADACSRAAERFAAAGDDRRRGMALRTLGTVLSTKGETAAAIEAFDAALTLARAAGDGRTEYTTLLSRGQAHQIRDEVQSALDDYSAALELARALGDLDAEARSLHELGVLHRVLGAPAAAGERLEQAEAGFAELGDDRRRAATLNQLGHLAQEAGDLSRALGLYRQARELRREAGDRAGEAATLIKLAGLHRERGEAAEALRAYEEAGERLGDLEDPWRRAALLVSVAALHEDAGRRDRARDAFDGAAALYREVGDATGEAESLLGRARNRAPGAADEAVASAEAALTLLETVRGSALRDDLRTSFFASVRGHYDVVIDLMMELDRDRPGEGWAARALGIAERARARALLDRLAETAVDVLHGVDPELLREERRLREELGTAETRRLRLVELDVPPAQVATVEGQARRLAEELEAARARIRAVSPRYAEATRVRTLAGDEIAALLDPGTELLVYHLGEAGSHLWRVTPEEVRAYELPPRRELEEAARQAHRLLASHQPFLRPTLAAALCGLSETLLGPVAGRLGAGRLVVVPDGALHYLPFAVLPAPGEAGGCAGAPPLLARGEVVHLPSASTLAAVRRAHAGRPSPDGLVAVLADPVFGQSDPRAPANGSPAVQDGAGAPAEYPRLPYTRQEAEAILALAPPERTFAAFGFEADVATVLGGRLAGYRLVHLATHGLLDETAPENSGLVLSQLDARGRPQDGFLHAHELYGLELAADLVVLSGCGTALGREVRGEGLVGLARAFMTAGAASLVVSLWRVSDRATARLMEELYRRILDAGESPAAALRGAQLAAWRRGALPAEWAAFVLQGDWRTAPAAGLASVTPQPPVPPKPGERSGP